MMEASGTAAEIFTSRIPIHSDVSAEWSSDKRLTAALSDGEDFELLFSVSGAVAETLQAAANDNAIPLFQIGRVTTGSGVRLIDSSGNSQILDVTGWQHRF